MESPPADIPLEAPPSSHEVKKDEPAVELHNEDDSESQAEPEYRSPAQPTQEQDEVLQQFVMGLSRAKGSKIPRFLKLLASCVILSILFMIPGALFWVFDRPAAIAGLPVLMWSVFFTIGLILLSVASAAVLLLSTLTKRSIYLKTINWYFIVKTPLPLIGLLWCVLWWITWEILANVFVDPDWPLLTDSSMVFLCAFLWFAAWVVEAFCVNLIAAAFMKKAYSERMVRALHLQFALLALSRPVRRPRKANYNQAPPPAPQPPPPRWFQPRFRQAPIPLAVPSGSVVPPSPLPKIQSGYLLVAKDIVTLDVRLQRKLGLWTALHLANIEASQMPNDSFMKIVAFLRKRPLTALFADEHGQVSEREIRNHEAATEFAKDLFHNILPRKSQSVRKNLLLHDFERLLGVGAESGLPLKTFQLFDTNKSGCIEEQEVIGVVTRAFSEHQAITSSLKDTKAVIEKLDGVLKIFTTVAMVFLSLLLLEGTLGQTMVTALSLFVGSAFAFGGSVQSIFESVVFIFGLHPYDVGDSCVIDDVRYIVAKIDLLSTHFTTFDGGLVMIPNSLLSQKKILNNRRSIASRRDKITFPVSLLVSPRKLDALSEDIRNFLAADSLSYDPHFELFQDSFDTNANYLMLSVWISHKDDWGNSTTQATLHSRAVTMIRNSVLQHEIQCEPLPVNVGLRTLAD